MTHNLARFPILIALNVTLLSGCVSVWHFEDFEKRVISLERDKANLAEEQQRDKERMDRLHQDLVEGTEALRKGGANLGADLDVLNADVARLKGTDEEISYALVKLQEDIELIRKVLDERGMPVMQLPKGMAEDREGLWTAGKAAYDKGDGATARGVLRRFLETFPNESRAPEAQFLVGETYFREGKFGQAIREFQRVHDQYRGQKGAPVGKSLLRIAESLLKQGDCEKAVGVYRYLEGLDKKAPEAETARNALKGLRKTCKKAF
jgi:TolA-binding protein